MSHEPQELSFEQFCSTDAARQSLHEHLQNWGGLQRLFNNITDTGETLPKNIAQLRIHSYNLTRFFDPNKPNITTIIEFLNQTWIAFKKDLLEQNEPEDYPVVSPWFIELLQEESRLLEAHTERDQTFENINDEINLRDLFQGYLGQCAFALDTPGTQIQKTLSGTIDKIITKDDTTNPAPLKTHFDLRKNYPFTSISNRFETLFLEQHQKICEGLEHEFLQQPTEPLPKTDYSTTLHNHLFKIIITSIITMALFVSLSIVSFIYLPLHLALAATHTALQLLGLALPFFVIGNIGFVIGFFSMLFYCNKKDVNLHNEIRRRNPFDYFPPEKKDSQSQIPEILRPPL